MQTMLNNAKYDLSYRPIMYLLIPSWIKQIGQELRKIQYFDNLTNKYKQDLSA